MGIFRIETVSSLWVFVLQHNLILLLLLFVLLLLPLFPELSPVLKHLRCSDALSQLWYVSPSKNISNGAGIKNHTQSPSPYCVITAEAVVERGRHSGEGGTEAICEL